MHLSSVPVRWILPVVALFVFANGLQTAFVSGAKTNASTNVKEVDQCAATSPTNRVAYVFYNPAAGGGSTAEQTLDTIHRILEPQVSVKFIPTDKHHPEKQCQKFVTKLLKSQPPKQQQQNTMVVAAGGDGTVSAVAKSLLNTGLPLGVIPAGTANAFATALGIPTSLEAACENLVEGHTRRIDAARCHPGKAMILLAGLGFEANMVAFSEGRWKKWLGRLAYIWGGAKETVVPDTFSCWITVDGQERMQLDAHAVTVAVVAPSGSISAQGKGEVVPDDGWLDVTIQTCDTVWQSLDATVHLLGSALVNRPTETDNILGLRAKHIQIRTKTKQRVVVDGELYSGRKSFTYEVLPNALEVIVPAATEEIETKLPIVNGLNGLE